MKIPAALTGFLLAGLPLHAAVVTTVDNTSPANDGQISLLEALTGITDGETISFNIPGAGPHYIVTPDGGYPLITRNGVTIDGYTQPGASANTALNNRLPNNAKLMVVLDSRTQTPGSKRTVLDFSGFGTSESAVLGLVDAHATTIRGLAFIGVAGLGSDQDAYVYNIGLVNECSGSKIQGCWFGLDPGLPNWIPGPDGVVAGVYGARSAVAAFRGENNRDSIGLTFGTDGNGTGDRGEGNICMAQRLAIHLQTPAVRIAGNWINVFPDGSMLNLDMPGLTLEDGTLEAIENGNPLGMLIGTDGNGTSDDAEGNIFGPIKYDAVVECWGSNIGIVFAGNSVGTGLDNLAAFTLPETSLFSLRKNSDLRVGSDMNGTGDQDEANHIYGLGGDFIHWHGSNNDPDGNAAVVNVRRNDLIDNHGPLPHGDGSLSNERAYAEVLADPSNPTVAISPPSTPQLLNGTAPLPKVGVPSPAVDIYKADLFGLYHTPPVPQGRSWLASFVMDGPEDLNPLPGVFSFDIQSLNLNNADFGRLTISATYTLTNGRAVTTNFSGTPGNFVAPAPLSDFTIRRDPNGLLLQWNGGTPPFGIYAAASLSGPWLKISGTEEQSITGVTVGPRRFYRVRDGLQ